MNKQEILNPKERSMKFWELTAYHSLHSFTFVAEPKRKRPQLTFLPTEISIGVPIKVLHEAEGLKVTEEINLMCNISVKH